MPHPRLTLALAVLEAIATLAFAISGFVEARKNRLDSVGTFIVATVTAFGGGTVRDVLLERRPFYWVVHEDYLLVVFGLSLVAPYVLRMLSKLSAERVLLVADAIGLGLFSISGTSIALDAGMPPFIAVLMGVITAVVGGILRDVLCNDIPLLLRDSRPYATCAFVGSWFYLLLDRLDVDPIYSVIAGTGFILIARLVTYKLEIRLPH
ncbi:TRIC cation channel family protein [Burkholderia guangdongensis]|uniref:TRIC cation channel family protein n=1 Tax=Burkholderia guangdongensis TaxID=1792500 RepID=UPI0015CAA920